MESTLSATVGPMAVSALTAIVALGACATQPTPKPTSIKRGLLMQTWAVPGWRGGHLALLDAHIFATDMNAIHALHRRGGVWFSAQIDRDERDQTTWLSATNGAFALLHGRQSLGLYDLRKRQVLYRLPCVRCGEARIIHTNPMVIQTRSQTSTATQWHVLHDRPWQVAWRWGMQADAEAQVIGEQLVIVTQNTIQTLDLKSGKTLAKHQIPWQAKPTGHVKWAVHQNKGLFASTSKEATSRLVLMDLSDGRVLKRAAMAVSLKRIMATQHGWLLGGASSAALWSWDLTVPRWRHKAAWTKWRWSTAQVNANYLVGRQAHDKIVRVIDLKSGLVDWQIETQSTHQPIAMDGQGHVVTSLRDGVLGLWRAPMR